MVRRNLILTAFAAGAVAIISAVVATAEPTATRAPARLVVVELFQSQGCSSCPPANANLNVLADRADLLTLSFGVTYWDQLGWVDTFAKPQYTARQWDYAHALNHKQVWTPQMVIDGQIDILGNDRPKIDTAIAKSRAQTIAGPRIALRDNKIEVGALAMRQRSPADVWLVRYDPRVVEVPIRRGENGGRTLPHRNIVKELVRIGTWDGTATQFNVPASANPAWSTAAFVQTGTGGPIIAAAKG